MITFTGRIYATWWIVKYILLDLLSDQSKKRRIWYNITCMSPQGNSCQHSVVRLSPLTLFFFHKRTLDDSSRHQSGKASSAQKQRREGRKKALQRKVVQGHIIFEYLYSTLLVSLLPPSLCLQLLKEALCGSHWGGLNITEDVDQCWTEPKKCSSPELRIHCWS